MNTSQSILQLSHKNKNTTETQMRKLFLWDLEYLDGKIS